MPVETASSRPYLATPPVGRLEIDTLPAEAAVASTAPDGTNAANAASASAASNSGGGGSGGKVVTREERERQIKLGLLLVRLGAATENSVFGARGLSVPPRDLLLIHRPEDDEDPRRPFKWYNPLSWFLSGPRPSPLRWSSSETPIKTKTAAAARAATRTTITTTTAASVIEAADAATSAAAAASEKVKKKKVRPLPVVNMQPLRDDSVLEPAVREERTKLFKDEEEVHRVLDRIEETRYNYLVPSQELRCEDAVIAVAQCYDKCNAVAQSRATTAAAIPTTPAAAVAEGKLFSNAALPAAAEALQCGPVVALLKRCAEGVAAAYSESESRHE
ncbi:hypothetical protein DQ04_10781020 [Trypanosoma grayi]|uniref:hypothetical protein n=1 Tax=Trypanosoma grayi TaxID=71804 RepID=UPI0004F4161A|nr:hypothetical protein DQ04_10781020 [Trypanosoma grayi]KEG07135.1 hypothetical protein DQ04_10781020 [Trypanosoma grayi]